MAENKTNIRTLYGSENHALNQDTISTDLDIMVSPHQRIHAGIHYNYTDIDTDVDIAIPKYYLLITPDNTTRIHFVHRVEGSLGITVSLLEGIVVSNNGTTGNVYNSDRNSNNTASLLVYSDPTVTSDGTIIEDERSGTAANQGKQSGEIAHTDEFILKQNTKYGIKITAVADNTVTSVHLDWYEI